MPRLFTLSAALAASVMAVPAVVTAQTAPAAPAVSASERVFVVPFRRGSVTVTNDAQEALDRIVAHAQRNRTMHLMISGLSAAGGSENARHDRAMQMAVNVQDYLQQSGVASARLHVEATGDLPSAAPAPAGVTDPAAGRVEVRFIAR